MESILTVGNGYLAVRGTLDTPVPGSQGDLFIAGVYDRKHPERPYSELEFLTAGRGDYPYSELVSAPFPFRLRLSVDGRPLDLAGPPRAGPPPGARPPPGHPARPRRVRDGPGPPDGGADAPLRLPRRSAPAAAGGH